MAETRFETQGAVLLAQRGGCAVWQFRSETGDVKLDLRLRHTGTFRFPSHHYHGLTIAFDRNIACRALPQAPKDFPVTPETIIARWALAPCPRVLHGADPLEHLFGELYRVPAQIRIPYFKVKILECR